MNTEEMIAVMQHYASGGKVELYHNGCWVEVSSPAWNWDRCDYRIAKAKPVLVPHWPAVAKDESGKWWVTSYLFSSLDHARSYHAHVTHLATEYPPVMLEASK